MNDTGADPRADFAGREGAALVVGGGGGLGREICLRLAERGSDVAVTYHDREAEARSVVAAVEQVGHRSWALWLDLDDDRSCAAAVEDVAALAGAIHTLVYAAGPHVPQIHLSQVDPALVRAQLMTDAAGFFAVAQAAVPYLRTTRGSLVAVSTAATRRFPVRDGLSSVPKAAVEAAVRGLAAEEGRYGVRANSVGPGMTMDGMASRLVDSGDLDERALDAARSNIALRRFGTAGDVAEAVCFLASDRAAFITGQHLAVDGGYAI